MAEKTRISISIEPDLLERFDKHLDEEGFPTRSEAIKELVRKSLIRKEWKDDCIVAGAVVVVYDHHKPQLVNKLIGVQHDFTSAIISSQHIHLDHDNCLEIIVVRGTPTEIMNLVAGLNSIKGLKNVDLVSTTTGHGIV